jgi:CRISPR/Cas system Type II protein with McrA/HNH and RuvC-like nuclease domain
MEIINDLEDLLQELSSIKNNMQALSDLEAKAKAYIQARLEENGLESYKSESYGTIRLQNRAQKDYGEEIQAMEDELKIRKKLADDLGDYKIVTQKQSIVYSPPKDLF